MRRNAYKRIEGGDYHNCPVVYLKPSGMNRLLNILADILRDSHERIRNPYLWNNNNYWRFVNDVGKKAADEMKRYDEFKQRK